MLAADGTEWCWGVSQERVVSGKPGRPGCRVPTSRGHRDTPAGGPIVPLLRAGATIILHAAEMVPASAPVSPDSSASQLLPALTLTLP